MSKRIAVVGPKLQKLLLAVLFLFACLTINSIYLAGVTFIEWLRDTSIQNLFYQWMFLGHLLLGLLLILPVIVYGIVHFLNARNHRNRRAVKVGYALFAFALVLLASGLGLTRGLPFVELKEPAVRTFSYWLHVLIPVVLAWLYILHRLAGKKIRWRSGGWLVLVASLISLVAIVIQLQDPRRWNQTGPASGEQYFQPSLARTIDGQFIKPEALMNDAYCQECHEDVHESWAQSAHRFSSFNNPVYAFSVNKTREFLQNRDGNVQAARFCAGCHDPVPFFAGAMDQADFGNHQEPMGQAGITCSVCHSITHINSTRGNADYTIEAPLQYPFAASESRWLQWLNRTLVKAKPAFHKQTFLKPLHSSAEFCASCHKVHLPQELNGYRWLRGQNHYDSFLLSGVSGHSVQSFYYPKQAQSNCNGCHMPAVESEDFGAKRLSQEQNLSVHNHQFAAGNTALPKLLSLPDSVLVEHEKMLKDSVRVDIFGIREAGQLTGKLLAPLFSTPNEPVLKGQQVVLQPGKKYLIEVVIRTLKLGHLFTEGTADSNQVWLNLTAKNSGVIIAQSGALDENNGTVDKWSHFVNAYVIDKDGNRIDRRNPENIFTKLYSNQIPPGASDVVHYLIEVPESGLSEEIQLEVELKYRKFDTQMLKHVQAEKFVVNDLPVVTIARDEIILPVENISSSRTASSKPKQNVASWERWNDYGIGLLRRNHFRQAEQAFKQVEMLGRADGALNLARLYLAEGRLDESALALQRASAGEFPAPAWTISYFTAQLNLQNGYFDEAIAAYRSLIETQYQEARDRGFDFSKDYRLINDLALALSERAKLEKGQNAKFYQREAIEWYQQTLSLDSENVTAHYGLAQLFSLLGDIEPAKLHRRLHAKYKPDDNAKDRAVQLARKRDSAADKAANKLVIIDLK